MTVHMPAKMFQPAGTTSAHLKMGLTGFAGSGKTKTSSIVARGMVKLARELRLPYADKPVFMLDTETGSDFIAKDFKADGIDFQVFKTRAFADLVPAVREAEKHASLLLIDAVTHYWREFCKTYQRERARKLKVPLYKLQPLDWGFLKGEWSEFTDVYVNSALDIIMAGRGAFEFDLIEDEDGRKELQKTDVKMAAEKETAFEPSLLVWMERGDRDMQTMQTYRLATVLKDRADLIDGQQFRNPTFENFLPHIKSLNLGGKHVGFDTERSSTALMPGDPREVNSVQRAIVLGEIEELLVSHFPSTSAEHKRNKIVLVRKHFQAAWPEIEKVMSLFDLRAGYCSLYEELEGKAPDKYTRSPAPATPLPPLPPAAIEINDGIPDSLRRAPQANGGEVDHNSWIEAFVGAD